MHANELSSNVSTFSFDVCVIGAGPAGITLSRELSKTSKYVALIEIGDASGLTEPLSEMLRGSSNVPNVSLLAMPYPMVTARSYGFGGSSRIWNLVDGWRGRPLDEWDFSERDWCCCEGWPIGYEEIKPFYDKALSVCGIKEWSVDDISALPGQEESLILEGGGLQTKCFLRLNRQCFSGLYEEIFADKNITYFPNTVAIDVLPEASAERIAAVVVKKLSGESFQIRADYVVVACGGLDTVQFLKNASVKSKFPKFDSGDKLGKGFMEHPHIWSAYLRLKKRADADKLKFYTINKRNGALVEGILTLSYELMKEKKLPNFSVWVLPMSAKEIAATVFRVLVNAKIERRYFKKLFRHLFYLADIPLQRLIFRNRRNNLFKLFWELEQLPFDESVVDVSSQKDALGRNRLTLSWQFRENLGETLRHLQQVLDSTLRRQGIGKIEGIYDETHHPAVLGIGNHQIGTARMHADPQKGVVDENCKVHGIENLYIVGSSVFPVAGAANPTLTVVALSIRLSAFIASYSSCHSTLGESQLSQIGIRAASVFNKEESDLGLNNE